MYNTCMHLNVSNNTHTVVCSLYSRFNLGKRKQLWNVPIGHYDLVSLTIQKTSKFCPHSAVGGQVLTSDSLQCTHRAETKFFNGHTLFVSNQEMLNLFSDTFFCNKKSACLRIALNFGLTCQRNKGNMMSISIKAMVWSHYQFICCSFIQQEVICAISVNTNWHEIDFQSNH